jgi:hypothetical protein
MMQPDLTEPILNLSYSTNLAGWKLFTAPEQEELARRTWCRKPSSPIKLARMPPHCQDTGAYFLRALPRAYTSKLQ